MMADTREHLKLQKFHSQRTGEYRATYYGTHKMLYAQSQQKTNTNIFMFIY